MIFYQAQQEPEFYLGAFFQLFLNAMNFVKKLVKKYKFLT